MGLLYESERFQSLWIQAFFQDGLWNTHLKRERRRAAISGRKIGAMAHNPTPTIKSGVSVGCFLPNMLPPAVYNGHVCVFPPVRLSLYLYNKHSMIEVGQKPKNCKSNIFMLNQEFYREYRRRLLKWMACHREVPEERKRQVKTFIFFLLLIILCLKSR